MNTISEYEKVKLEFILKGFGITIEHNINSYHGIVKGPLGGTIAWVIGDNMRDAKYTFGRYLQLNREYLQNTIKL